MRPTAGARALGPGFAPVLCAPGATPETRTVTVITARTAPTASPSACMPCRAARCVAFTLPPFGKIDYGVSHRCGRRAGNKVAARRAISSTTFPVRTNRRRAAETGGRWSVLASKFTADARQPFRLPAAHLGRVHRTRASPKGCNMKSSWNVRAGYAAVRARRAGVVVYACHGVPASPVGPCRASTARRRPAETPGSASATREVPEAELPDPAAGPAACRPDHRTGTARAAPSGGSPPRLCRSPASRTDQARRHLQRRRHRVQRRGRQRRLPVRPGRPT